MHSICVLSRCGSRSLRESINVLLLSLFWYLPSEATQGQLLSEVSFSLRRFSDDPSKGLHCFALCGLTNPATLVVISPWGEVTCKCQDIRLWHRHSRGRKSTYEDSWFLCLLVAHPIQVHHLPIQVHHLPLIFIVLWLWINWVVNFIVFTMWSVTADLTSPLCDFIKSSQYTPKLSSYQIENASTAALFEDRNIKSHMITPASACSWFSHCSFLAV